MMEALGRYIVSVSAAAIFCGILKSILPPKGTIGSLLRLMAGIFLSFVVIRPLIQVDLGDLPVISQTYLSDGAAVSAEGEILAGEAMTDIIRSRTEAYILDKAQLLQAELTVSVVLSDDTPPVPVSVQFTGPVSPYAKARLEAILQQELGIAKENLIWIG